MVELFANSGDPDQTPHSVASDLGLHCCQLSFLGICRLQWAKIDANSGQRLIILTECSGIFFSISPKKCMLWVLIRSATFLIKKHVVWVLIRSDSARCLY